MSALANCIILDQRLDMRCDNWGEYMRWRARVSSATRPDAGHVLPRRYFFACAKSFETNYRSPQGQHWHYGSAPTRAPEADANDAEEIEQAVSTLDLYHHAILRGWHVERMSEPVCLRKAAKAARQPRGNVHGFLASLGMAYGALTYALTLPAVVRKERALARVQAILRETT